MAELVLCRDGNRVSLFMLHPFCDARFFLCNEILGGRGGEVPWRLFTLVDSKQLELEAFYVFLAGAVVANDPHICHLTQVVLALLKEDLRVADSGAHPDEATDFGLEIQHFGHGRCLNNGAIDINHTGSVERRKLLVSLGPVTTVLWGELGPQTVLNRQVALLNVSSEHHGSWEPVGDGQLEGVRVLSGVRGTVNELSHLEDGADDREIAMMIPVDGALALAMGFLEVDLLLAVQTNCDVVGIKHWLHQVDVHDAMDQLAGRIGHQVILQLDENLSTTENFLVVLMRLFYAHSSSYLFIFINKF